jgi:hypothetical protein
LPNVNKKTYSTGESLLLLAAGDIVEIMFGESYAKELRKIPLAHNTMRRRISDISDEPCDRLICQLTTFRFAFQVDEATDVVEDAHLIS